jgi:uncharacterized protein (TIGR02599 family)
MTRQAHSRAGFTILELMVAIAVLGLLLGILISLLSATSSVTQQATEKISAFQGARRAFQIISSVVSQATLNSYWDYDDPVRPSRYVRKSHLHFLVGPAGQSSFPGTPGTGQAILFQAPLGRTLDTPNYGGMEDLLNAGAFFVRYGADDPLPSPPFPPSTTTKYRYQLMQAVQPTEKLDVYDDTTNSAWINGITSDLVAPIAENVILLIAWPRMAPQDDAAGSMLTATFSYDSRLNATSDPQPVTAHQLPPTVQFLMVAIDEVSAARYCVDSTPPAKISGLSSGLFQTSDETAFANDLEELRRRLGASGLKYRIFTSTVPIRESKMQ